MTEREAFEEWITNDGRAPLAADHNTHWMADAARRVWQAACAWQREQDAKVCDGIELREWHSYQGRTGERYKVGSDYWQGFSDGAGGCAAAIRAQGEQR